MPFTNFPNGVTSFGIPLLGSGLSKGLSPSAKIWFVDVSKGHDAQDGLSPGTAFATVGKAVTKLSDGDYIFIGPGDINECVVITNKWVTVIGSGTHCTRFKPSAATTKTTVTPLGEVQMLAVAIVTTGRGCEFAHFSIQASNTTDGGMYIGDGGRVNSQTLGVGNPHGTLVHDVDFDGNGVMEWGVTLDGMGAGTRISNCHFFNINPGGATGGGVILCSGTNLDQVGAKIQGCYFTGIKGNGVKRATGSVCYGNVIGPGNAFADFSTVAAVESVVLGAGGGPDSIVGNHFGAAHTFSALATDFQSGNSGSFAGNVNTYISQG